MLQGLSLCFLAGTLLALSSGKTLGDADSPWRNHGFSDAAAFAFYILLPSVIFLYAQWPAWAWSYFVDPAEVSLALTALAVLAYPIILLLGFLLTAALLAGDTPRAATIPPAIATLLLLATAVIFFQRSAVLVSFADFAAVSARKTGAKPLAWNVTEWTVSIIALMVFASIPFFYLTIRNIRWGRQSS